MTFKIGNFVDIKCEVQPGPFLGEHLVTIETINGTISGFVRESELKQEGHGWQVRGKVTRISPDAIEVRILGSFFTTNGIASVQPHQAMIA